MEVTKKKAAHLLGISENEVLRRVHNGQLIGRQKTPNKFSDWVITVPDTLAPTDKTIEKEVREVVQGQPMTSQPLSAQTEDVKPEPPTETPVEEPEEIKVIGINEEAIAPPKPMPKPKTEPPPPPPEPKAEPKRSAPLMPWFDRSKKKEDGDAKKSNPAGGTGSTPDRGDGKPKPTKWWF